MSPATSLLAIAAVAVAFGCQEDAVLPTAELEEEDFVGTYDATSLVVGITDSDGSEATDVDALAVGAELTIHLRADGTASGTASFLGFDAIGQEETLHGGWEFDDAGNRVILDIPRISRLDGVELAPERSPGVHLHAEGEVAENRFGVTRFDVVLTQQDATP